MKVIAIAVLAAILAGSLPSDIGSAQEATPQPVMSNGLAAMLHLAPDVMAGPESPETQIVAYADLKTQLDAIGLPRPSSIDDEEFVRWSYGLESLHMPELMLVSSFSARWKELIGFDILDLDETLEIGEPPARTLMRGRFEEAAIEEAWARHGYQVSEVDGLRIASLDPNGGIDINSEIGRYAFSRFNNAVFLPDGTLAYSPTLDGLREIIAVAHSTAPSLADRTDVSSLVRAMDEPLVSALLLTGDSLRYESLLGPGADQVTPFPDVMPAVELALFGITAGGPVSRPLSQASSTPDIPRATFKIALLHRSETDAVASAQIASNRLASATSWYSNRPLAEMFESVDARALTNPPVMLMSLRFAEDSFAIFWLRMILTRDLPFLAW